MSDMIAHMQVMRVRKEDTPRERRKRETLERIERNAVALALRGGSEAVTVEEICDLSAISVRTFYNYCDSKDAAIVGTSPVIPSDDALERFRSGSGMDILGDLLDAVSGPFEALDAPTGIDVDRARLLRAEPALLESMGLQMTKVRSRLADLVAERLARSESAVGGDDDIRVQAETIVELKTAIMRTALFAWSRSTERTFADARRYAQAVASRHLSA